MDDESSEQALDFEAVEDLESGEARARFAPAAKRGIDQHFAEYKKSGDPRALARVFDLVAADLLFLADQIVGDPTLAEDLVQEAFLVAVERAATWKADRGVKSWLIDILQRLARRAREDSNRVIDRDRVPKERVLDPTTGLEQRELMRELRRALLEVPERNRDVLRLYLLHGMTLSEVADALGRPREAVKAQHRRGMRQLRRLLPPGLSIGSLIAAVTLTAPRGLTQVRHEVLKRASELAPAATAGTTTLVSLVVVGFALVLCAIYPFLTSERDPALASTGPTAQPGVNASAVREDAPRATELRVARRVEPVPNALRTGTIEVQIRHRVDGRPVSSVGVRVVARDRRTLYRSISAMTDRDGRCLFEGVLTGEYWAVTTQGHSSRVQVDADSVARLSLTTSPGVTLRGRVVDPRGHPVIGARVRVGNLPGLLELHAGATDTDRRGRFEIRDLRPGSFVAVVAPGHVASRLHWCTQAVGTVQEEQIEMVPTLRVRGVVVYGDGRPAGFARLLFGKLATQPLGHAQLPTSALADAAGQFDFEVPRYSAPRWLWVRSADSAPLAIRLDVAQASLATLRLQLPLAARIGGIVRDRSGRVVPGATLRAFPDAVTQTPKFEQQVPLWARRECVSDADGRFELSTVGPGRVFVRAEHPERGAARRSLLAVAGVESRWDPILRELGTISGQVVDPSGQPLAGWQAALSSPDTPTVATLTDARGYFRFENRNNLAHRLALRPVVPHVLAYPPVEFEVRTAGSTRRYRVDALPVCALRAVLPNAVTSLPLAMIDVILEDRRTGCTIRLYDIATDPVLELGGLLAGRFELRIRSRGEDLVICPDVVLRPWETVDLGLLAAVGRGRLVGTVRDAAGTAAPSGTILLSDAAQHTRTIAVRSGTIDETALPAGEYGALFVTPDGRHAYARCEVRDGATKSLDLEVGSGLPVRFVGSERDTVVGRFAFSIEKLEDADNVEVLALAGQSTLTTKESRSLRLPVGRYRLVVREVRSQSKRDVLFEVASGTTTVRIPRFGPR